MTLLITGAAGTLSLVTVLGNLLVLLSVGANRHLQTVNNYFLFSLACADLLMGVFSMNVYTAYVLIGRWPFGLLLCRLWLVLDYVVSNSSNMHLLLISVDRYLCVTRPLTYPSRRTRRFAGLMVLAAWVLSLVLWAPAILIWQRFHGQRLRQRDECYIQLLSSPTVTLATAVPSFYLPAALMTVLYARISRAGRRRSDRQRFAPNSAGTVRTVRTCAPTHAATSHVPVAGAQAGPAAGDASAAGGRGGRRGQLHRIPPAPRFSILCARQQTLGDSDSTPERDAAACTTARRRRRSERRKRRERRGVRSSVRERKVTRTVLAVLLAFMVTWTPYNIMVLVGTFCHLCVWDSLWAFGYWLRYLNSAINPACYALCNATFKKTFQNLLLCRYKNINSK